MESLRGMAVVLGWCGLSISVTTIFKLRCHETLFFRGVKFRPILQIDRFNTKNVGHMQSPLYFFAFLLVVPNVLAIGYMLN